MGTIGKKFACCTHFYFVMIPSTYLITPTPLDEAIRETILTFEERVRDGRL